MSKAVDKGNHNAVNHGFSTQANLNTPRQAIKNNLRIFHKTLSGFVDVWRRIT